MLCGTNANIERPNLNEKVDRLQDLTTGFGACEEASELMVASAEEFRGEREGLEEHLHQIDAD
jgi:hypothetical protein